MHKLRTILNSGITNAMTGATVVDADGAAEDAHRAVPQQTDSTAEAAARAVATIEAEDEADAPQQL